MIDKDYDQPEFSIEDSDNVFQYKPEKFEVDQTKDEVVDDEEKDQEEDQKEEVEKPAPKRRGRPRKVQPKQQPKQDVEVVVGAQCPVCGAKLQKPSWAGQEKKCPNCSRVSVFKSIAQIVRD